MITHSWSIDTIKHINAEGYTGVVVQVYWTKTGQTSDGKVGKFNGCTSFSLNDLNSETFTALEDLSNDQIISWIESSLSEEAKIGIDAAIESKLS